MNNFKAGLVCDFGIRQIYIKKDGGLTKIEGENPKEVEKQLHENRDHLAAYADEENVHPRLDFPIWPFQEKIIIYMPFVMEEPNFKGIVV